MRAGLILRDALNSAVGWAKARCDASTPRSARAPPCPRGPASRCRPRGQNRPWHGAKFEGLAGDFANGIIAKQVIELAKAGERNPTCLCEGAIEKLREHLYGD